MDRLPRELVDAILLKCLTGESKNEVLELRLVCRVFDRTLKPYACRTLGLDFSRLSRLSGFRRPQADALQTIGYHCKSLYVDLMVLRDDMEVEFLEAVFARVPSMTDFCQTMQRKYCLNDASFTETEYLDALETMLFNCRDVDRLRLNLPFQLVGRHVNAATMILANTLKAFANRPEEDSADLETLVLENVTDVAICHLWMNPSDVMNIMGVVAALKHLVLTLRRHENEPPRVGWFGACLWNLIENAGLLESLCLIGMDHEDKPPRGLKQTRFWQLTPDEWRARSLPAPRVYLAHLACLELKRVEMLPEILVKMMEELGDTLEELYLNEVYLKAEQARDWNADSKKVLWVGLPNLRAPDDGQWLAMAVRCAAPRLRLCRASFLAYDHYLREDGAFSSDFDLVDPCGLGRGLSQRFVEVVLGVPQPNDPSSGDPVEYLPRDPADDRFIAPQPRSSPASQTAEHDLQQARQQNPPPPPPPQQQQQNHTLQQNQQQQHDGQQEQRQRHQEHHSDQSRQPAPPAHAPARTPLRIEDYDVNAYQMAVANPTSQWHKSIDGVFANCNQNTLDELHYIAETACRGMNEIHRRRGEWTTVNGVANEYSDNLIIHLPSAEDAEQQDAA
ncbi:hypothetical protein JDV02_001608 [Purpureocillium takamizusanense]|uniref:Uncharacterized protein n=1 Tax=Purpureocillium takamizusanense TaxID=2060973 RepID=A0A9Q8V801_9HYPO|nr:uncharacterized protein JDV02_001608 [Purpureocillium takamizusanense]UNI15036.1 hypothetical protein JDV02_001608 [Purpureocillium takamizusanense]